MQIKTYGDFEKTKILLFHPLFTNDKVFDKLKDKLIKDYYVIIPIMSGHFPNSTYKSLEKEELELSIYLKSHNINKIDILFGTSFGSIIAYDFYHKNSDLINRLIIDSPSFHKVPFIIRIYVYHKIHKILINIIRNKNNSELVLNKNHKILNEYQKDILPTITETSLKNIINTYLNTNIHYLSKKEQEKITFVYGSKDINKRTLFRFRKYKFSNFILINNASACEYFIKKPTSYIKKVINNNNYDKIDIGDK